MTTEKLIDKYNTLIVEYGEGGRLDFSVYCKDLPVLSGKLIFGIGFKDGGIAFYYDCDLKDYMMFGDFNEDELYDFYVNVVNEMQWELLISIARYSFSDG